MKNHTTMNDTTLIEGAIDCLLYTREMCGNEGRALREWQADNDVEFSLEEKAEIWLRVENQWNAYRKQAGVRP